jgi:hypothetical protein
VLPTLPYGARRLWLILVVLIDSYETEQTFWIYMALVTDKALQSSVGLWKLGLRLAMKKSLNLHNSDIGHDSHK